MKDTATTEQRTPFLDDALLEQRQQQREVLLSIPKWLADQVRVDDVINVPAGPNNWGRPTPAQRLLVERHARDRVDDLLDELQVGMVSVIDRGVAETVAAHLDAVLANGSNRGARIWRESLGDDLEADIEVNEPRLGEMIDLLLLADDLADDGFTDTRFA
jgi:hypothetical protein